MDFLMDEVCLIINLSTNLKQATLLDLLSQHSFVLKNQLIDNLEDAEKISKSHKIYAQCIFCEEYNLKLESFLTWFRDHVAGIPCLQVLFCSRPSVDLLIDLFEFGMMTVSTMEKWQLKLAHFHTQVKTIVSDRKSVEAKCLRLAQAIINSEHDDIKAIGLELHQDASAHYLAAHYCAIAQESEGKFEKSLDNFKLSEQLNPFYIPAQMGYSEVLLLLGRVKESVRQLKLIDTKNPMNSGRKLILANAYCDLGDVDGARNYIEQASKLGADKQKCTESHVHLLIAQGKLGEALKLFEQLTQVGPHLALKLYDLGVSLSQAGKGKSALILYKKAHRIVRNDLKYKVSLSAALACLRIKDFDLCLKYLERCQNEFGRSFEKLEKIRKFLSSAISREND